MYKSISYLNIKAVVLGSLMRIMTAANRLGLYSAFLACKAIFFRSKGQPRLTVETIFCSWGTIPGSIEGAEVEVCNWVIGVGGIGLGGAGLATGA